MAGPLSAPLRTWCGIHHQHDIFYPGPKLTGNRRHDKGALEADRAGWSEVATTTPTRQSFFSRSLQKLALCALQPATT